MRWIPATALGVCAKHCGGVLVVSDLRVEVLAVCEMHAGSTRLVVRAEGQRLVLDGHADQCCVLSLERAAVVGLFEMIAEWL